MRSTANRMQANNDDWEDDDLSCDWCGQGVSHGIEGCPEEWHCLYPGTCLMGFTYQHHNSECSTAEMQAAHDRLYWWLNFWDHHPQLFALYTKWNAVWAWCRNPFAAREPEDKSDVPF